MPPIIPARSPLPCACVSPVICSASLSSASIHIEAGSALAGKTLTEAAIPAKIGALVLAVRHQGVDHFDYNPHGATKLVSGLTLIVMGDLPAIEKLRQMAGASSRRR